MSRLSVDVSSFSHATTQVLPLIATTWWNESPLASSAVLAAPNVAPPSVDRCTMMSPTPPETVWYATMMTSVVPGATASCGFTAVAATLDVTLMIVPHVWPPSADLRKYTSVVVPTSSLQ